MGYYFPLSPRIKLGQTFGSNPNWGPNPAGGHNGDDWLSQTGENVYAAGDGEVVYAGRFDSTYADNWGWNLNFGGQMVVLNMDGDTAPYFEYGHLSAVFVQTGARVKAGQVIGLTGADDGGTGVITGPHLHVGCLPYNYNLNTPTYGRVNPRLYMDRYWDDSQIELQGSITVTSPQEDELSAAEVDALRADLFHVFDRLKAELPGDTALAVVKQPIAYADPETAQPTGQTTSLGALATFSDFQHSATRRTVADAARAIVDAVKAAPAEDATQAAEDAYKAFLDKLGNTKINLSVQESPSA